MLGSLRRTSQVQRSWWLMKVLASLSSSHRRALKSENPKEARALQRTNNKEMPLLSFITAAVLINNNSNYCFKLNLSKPTMRVQRSYWKSRTLTWLLRRASKKLVLVNLQVQIKFHVSIKSARLSNTINLRKVRIARLITIHSSNMPPPKCQLWILLQLL